MAFMSHRQELFEGAAKGHLDPTISKYTPKRRPSEGQVFCRMENELTKITKKLDQMNEMKEQQKELRNAAQATSTKDKIYNLLKARNSFEKENTATKCQSKDEHAPPTPLRDRINSYREEKKTINTFRSEKEKQPNVGRSEQQTLKDYKKQPTDSSFQTLTLLMGQNEKLAIRVGELESLCQSMSHKLGFFKAKYEQDTHKLSEAKVEQAKQNLYLQKLVYYYKSLSERLAKKLIENGIEPDELISESSISLAEE